MNLSPEGRSLLKSLEGEVKRDGRHVVYDDATGRPFDPTRYVGNPTVGHGHLLKPGEDYSAGLSDGEADELLMRDLERFEVAVDGALTEPFCGQEFDAFVIFAFNVGVGSLKRASAVTAFNNGHKNEVPARLALWNKARLADGSLVENAGLKRRRHVEGTLFANGFESAWKAWRS